MAVEELDLVRVRTAIAAIILTVAIWIVSSGFLAAQTDWRAASNLEERGLQMVWHDHLNDATPGERMTGEMIYGNFLTGAYIDRKGGFKEPKKQILETFRTVGTPPSDTHQRRAIQYDIPGIDEVPEGLPDHRQVPTASLVTLHFPDGVTRAGLAMDLWLPEDATFTSHGRWPIGLWVGPEGMESPRRSSGGTPPEKQRAATLRLNRSKGNEARTGIYSYHLNRLKGESGYIYSSKRDGKVYGYPGSSSDPIPRGRWVTLEMEMWMNTPGKTDGGMALWHDGELVQKIDSGIDWGADQGWAIRGIVSYQMWHGGAPAESTRYWISNIRLYSGDKEER